MHVAVIGAGAAGLAACRELGEAGLEVTAFERASGVGGTWVYEERVESDPLGRAPNERLHASMYASLRTNLPRELMAFRGHPFRSARRFPGHAEVAEYLRGFAEAEALGPMIRFRTVVERVDPRTESGAAWRWVDGEAPERVASWRVTSRGLDGVRTESFDAVAVCNGHYAVPRVPSLPGLDAFDGTVLHSHNYRRPESFAGQRVVLLGAKASGIDLSRDLAGHARQVVLCAREHEGVRVEGLHSNIARRPAIARLHPGRTIELTDGTRVPEVDALILCTGYEYSFPFLDPVARVIDVVERNVQPLWLSLLAARCPSAAFIGLPFQVVPFALVERQAAFFGATLTGRAEVPSWSERIADVRARERTLLERGVARRHFLMLGDEQAAYDADLERRCGYPSKPAWFTTLHQAVREHRHRHPDDYRDRELSD